MNSKKENAKVIATRSLIAILCILFGILIAGQLRSIPDRVTNPIAPYTSLKQTKEDLYTEQGQLKTEITNLQKSLSLVQASVDSTVLSKNEISALNYKKAQAGLTRLNGPGVIITLDDSDQKPATEDSIVHAADLRDAINILWGSGAEAIAINGQRIVANTAIDCIVNTILINNVRISNPFRIEAVGDQNLMYSNISDPASLRDIYNRKNKSGLKFDFSRNHDITVPMFNGSFDISLGAS